MDALVWALTELFGTDIASLDDVIVVGERTSAQQPRGEVSNTTSLQEFQDMNLGGGGMGGMNL